MRAVIATNHHLTPQYLEYVSHDELVHLQYSSYSILNQPIDMECNNLVCAIASSSEQLREIMLSITN